MMGERSRVPLILGILVACSICLPLFPVNASSAQGVTVKVNASPSQVLESQNTTLTAVIKNVGNASLRAFYVTVVIPRGWNQSLLKPGVTGSIASNPGKAGSGNYSLGTLVTNQTFILQVDIRVTVGTQAGNYTIFLITNPESPGVSQVSASIAVRVVGPAALPLGGAAIPISLILILLPGFAAIMLIVWVIGRSLDVTWQTGLVVTLMSFFLGFFAWYVAGYFVGRGSNLIGMILNLDIFTISKEEVAIVTGLAALTGIVGGIVVLALNVAKRKLEDWAGLITQGYIRSNEKVWRALLNSAFENAIRQHGGGWAPVVSITTTDDVSYPGTADRSKPVGQAKHPDAPHVTVVETTTKTDSSQEAIERKDSPMKETQPTTTMTTTTIEGKHEKTETKSQTTENTPPSPPKVSRIAGLLDSFDDTDPFDIVVGPQYEVELMPGSEGFRKLSRMIKYQVSLNAADRGDEHLGHKWVKWDEESLKNADKWDKDQRQKWEAAALKSRYHRNFPDRMTKLLANLEESESIRLMTGSEESGSIEERPVHEGQPVPGEGGEMVAKLIGFPGAVVPSATGEDAPRNYVTAQKWVKRAEVLAVDVFAPKPLYVFRLGKGKNAPN